MDIPGIVPDLPAGSPKLGGVRIVVPAPHGVLGNGCDISHFECYFADCRICATAGSPSLGGVEPNGGPDVRGEAS
jgi:hypothetical protein